MESQTCQVTVKLSDASETDALGRQLAPLFLEGDVIFLKGKIGAGKTHLARAIIQALVGQEEEVPSPTYTLIQTYEADRFQILHADLYRLGDTSELLELGLLDELGTALLLVEWPERMSEFGVDPTLTIELCADGEGRAARLTSETKRWSGIQQGTLHA